MKYFASVYSMRLTVWTIMQLMLHMWRVHFWHGLTFGYYISVEILGNDYHAVYTCLEPRQFSSNPDLLVVLPQMALNHKVYTCTIIVLQLYTVAMCIYYAYMYKLDTSFECLH